jgi:hypothetical protein
MKFGEGQQVWVCANLGGQIVRQKGIVFYISMNKIHAGSFATEKQGMVQYEFDSEGRNENLWLEARMT